MESPQDNADRPSRPFGRWAEEPPAARITAVSVAVIATILVFGALREGQAIAVPTLLAGFFALLLAPVAMRLERWAIPRGVAAFIVVMLTVGALAAVIYTLLPTAEAWNDRAPDIVRKIEQKIRTITHDVSKQVEDINPEGQEGGGSEGGGGEGDGEDSDEGAADEATSTLVRSGGQMLADTVMGTPVIFAGMIYGAFLTFFLLAERQRVSRWVLALGARFGSRSHFASVMRDIESRVTSFLLAVTLINICLGFATAATFYLLEVPSPAVWGAAMTLLNFMPYLGPLIMNIITFGIGLASFPTIEEAFIPVAALAALNTIEGNFITPHVVGRKSRVGTLPIFLGVAYGAWLWGAAGAILATPMVIVGHALLYGPPKDE